ncbi:hypothetical protein O181_073223 [Austropuccinia psidii MF-1]|uniref:Retrovirus-related Pol polyprotein from transposon RE2 n=1 Tax=Austropuccinia psidii MF-1 TaxID=1389203 RepID=A0A9Q3F4J4_9BASI|nr:hypothetical protein [Austropuccinia psidii MF-1]
MTCRIVKQWQIQEFWKPVMMTTNKNYRQAIGKISYLQVATRPHLAFVTSQLSQFLEKPGYSHWIAFKHLLQYLAGSYFSLCSYSDADYANCIKTQRSVSGYLTMISNSCINWKSRKQNTVSTSSCEAEYKAQYEGAKDLLWSARLLEELGISVAKPLQLFGTSRERSPWQRILNLTKDQNTFMLFFTGYKRRQQTTH